MKFESFFSIGYTTVGLMAREVSTVVAIDDQIVVRAVAGDRDALIALFERFGPQISLRIAARLGRHLQSVLDADDVMQVTYLDAFLQIAALGACDSRSFCAWLTRAAENNLCDAIRGLRREKQPPPANSIKPLRDHESSFGLFELVSGSGRIPIRGAARGEICLLIEAAVRKLPDDYAEVIRLYDLQGRPAADVGERIGRSRGAVHMLRTRALGRLRALLGYESSFFSACA